MIPTYNQEDKIERAIQSAIAQDYENLEIIIADDCSTDNTEHRVKKYLVDERIKYYKHKTNVGRVANYRYTLESLASGEWVVNLDGDDFYIDNSFISYAVSKLNLYKDDYNIVFIQTARENRTINDINSKGVVIGPNIEDDEKIVSGDFFLKKAHKSFFSHMTTLYNRSEAIKIGFYRYDILSSDMESILRLALKGDVLLSKKVSGVWVNHGNNASLASKIEELDKNTLYIESVYCEAKNSGVKNINKWRNQKIAEYWGDILFISLRQKRLLSYLIFTVKNYYYIFLSCHLYSYIFRRILKNANLKNLRFKNLIKF
jgi:glycosyltransferase involved in cell wall biosynthesis